MSDSLRHIWTIAKRELSGYFTSPIAYVVIVIFLILIGVFTFIFGGFFEFGEASLSRPCFHWHPWIYLFLVPAVGMRLWSEERRLGTMELLLTMPITTWQAIVGKFVASWLFLIICLALTFPVVLTTSYLGDPDGGTIFAGYLGSALMAGAYLAITCLTSAMTRNQVISFIISVVICFLLIIAGIPPVIAFFRDVLHAPDLIVALISSISTMTHFLEFQRGVVGLHHVVFFLSIMAFALFSTSVVIRNLRAG